MIRILKVVDFEGNKAPAKQALSLRNNPYCDLHEAGLYNENFGIII